MIREYQTRVDVIRNGATVTSLNIASPPNIACSSTGEIKTSISATFYDNDDVDWLIDELKPFQIINGIEYPVGVFSIATIVDNYDENGCKTLYVEAYDRGLILKQKTAEKQLFFKAGTKYLSAIGELLLDAGLTLWTAIQSEKRLATDRAWPIGVSYLTIVNSLLSEINYSSIWFDENGFGILEPLKTASVENIKHQYSAEDGLKVLKRPCSRQVDVFDAPNVFVVVCQNPDLKEPLTSVAVNESPISKLSVFNRQRRIATLVRIENTPDQETLDEYASRLVFDSMMVEETVVVSTANMPGHTVNNIVSLIHPDISGLFQETGWTLVLASGQEMQHTLRRSVIV